MYTTPVTSENYLGSRAYIPVSGAAGLRCCEARRTGVCYLSGKAVYELIDENRRRVSNILYVIDNQALVPVVQYRAGVLEWAAEYEAAMTDASVQTTA
jgi:hypothetical protein